MKDKTKGTITPIASILIMIVVGIIVGLIVGTASPSGWGALAAIIFVFMLTGLIILIEFIIGLVLYFKKQSDYGLGLIYGFVGIVGVGILFNIFMLIYNSVV